MHFFNETNTIFTLLAIYLGTNLLFWTTFDAGAPHTILFTMYLLLIWNTIQWHEKPKKRLAIIIGVLLGLIIASRPSEIIAIIIPLFWNIKGKATLLTKLKLVWSNRWHFVLLIISVVLMGLPQMAYYQHYTGHLFVSTYNDPQSTLDFSNPRISWVLFSYRKGLFLYAPLMIFSVLGIVKLVQRQFNIALAIVLFLFVNLIFIASFTSLISYGYRAFIQSYAILILPLGFFIESILTKKLWIKLLSLSLLLFFVWFSSIETWQIINGFIDSSRMTKAYYWKVFGKMNIRPTDKNLLMINPYLDDETGNKLADSLQLQRKVLVYHDFNNDSEYLGVAFTSSGSIEIGQAKPFSPATKKAFKEITSKDYFWARISFRYKYDSLIESSDLLLVSTFTYQGGIEKNKNQAYKYRAFKIPVDSTKVHQWQSYSVDYLSPEVSTPDDRFETYVWNRGKKLVLLDDFQITIFEPKD